MINWSLYMVHLFQVLCAVRFLFQGLTQDVFACCFWRLPCAMTAPQTVHMFWRSWQPWRGSSGHFIQCASISVCLIFPPKVRQNGCVFGMCQGHMLSIQAVDLLRDRAALDAHRLPFLLCFSTAFWKEVTLWSLPLGRGGPCSSFWRAMPTLAVQSYTMKLCLLLSRLFIALLTGAHLFYSLGYNPMLL